MTKRFETVTVTTVRDYNRATGYEFVILGDLGNDNHETLERVPGYRTKAQAHRAGVKAAEKYLAD